MPTSFSSPQLPVSSRLNSTAPAYMFAGYGFHIGDTATSNQIQSASCSSNELMLYASLYLTDDSSGPIVVLSCSLGTMPPLFGLYGDSKSGNVMVAYLSGGQSRLEAFDVRLTTGTWYKVAAILSGNTLSLYLGCKLVASRRVPLPDYCLKNSVTVSVGTSAAVEQPFYTGLYAFMQQVGVAFGDNSLAFQCTDLPYTCATCGQYIRLLRKLHELQEELNLAQVQLNGYITAAAPQRDTPVATSCSYGNSTYPDGSFASAGMVCCYCRMGMWTCNNSTQTANFTVPSVTTPTLVPTTTTAPSLACPYSEGTTSYRVPYDDYIVTYDTLTQSCKERKCTRITGSNVYKMFEGNSYSCWQNYSQCLPTFNTLQMRVSLCCPNTNCTMCNFVSCPSNSACISKQSSYSCTCNTGYDSVLLANGSLASCKDHNECAGGIGNGENDCPGNSTCVNTIGSFACSCNSGLRLLVSQGSKSCQDIDECQGGASCPANSVCTNTVGSYYCQCNDGYRMENGTCKPICNPPCQYNMPCVSPNTCHCEGRFNGTRCESDVNECAQNNSCSPDTTICINTVGSYFCQCRQGFVMTDTNECKDINECAGNPCSVKDAKCTNTVGSYQCSCKNDAKCTETCLLPSGSGQTLSSGQWKVFNCNNYTCVSGKLVSTKLPCDCTSKSFNISCCPECQQRNCSFTRSSGQTLRMLPGTTWIDPADSCYQCTCNKETRNVMCQNMTTKCPSLSSCPSDRIYTQPNQCCPLCELPTCNKQSEGIVLTLTSGCETCLCRSGKWQCSTTVPSNKCTSEGSNCTTQSAIFSDHCCPVCTENVLGSTCKSA
eukprot:Em0021g373a